MSSSAPAIIEQLHERFLLDFPHEAARELDAMAPQDVAALLASHPRRVVTGAWEALAPDVACEVLVHFPDSLQRHVLAEADPTISVAALAQLDSEQRNALLAKLDTQVARELKSMSDYPEDSAGRVMNSRIAPLRDNLTIGEAIERLRAIRQRGMRELIVVDNDGRLIGRVETEDLVLAGADQPLQSIVRGIAAAVQEFDAREDVVEIMHNHSISVLPVVNQTGRYVGVIRETELISAVEQETSIDIQTMVGASRDERALSRPMFAVRKRLPWLQINLATAFAAAAVVGLFEGMIAKFTALAVLLPVVAGQSGNAGAQALAVTMRGLVLREINLRHWRSVIGKEALTGLVNGCAVAATTALGVYVWSRSGGLVGIIAISMVISMVAAGLAGALVPILLHRFGQDPATASSIILTTVTDIVGFFSFLGTATLLAHTLEPSL